MLCLIRSCLMCHDLLFEIARAWAGWRTGVNGVPGRIGGVRVLVLVLSVALLCTTYISLVLGDALLRSVALRTDELRASVAGSGIVM